MSVYDCRTPNGFKRARQFRAWLNGEEVTRWCFYADPRRGVVRLFVHRDGKPMATADVVAKEERRGHVEVRRG